MKAKFNSQSNSILFCVKAEFNSIFLREIICSREILRADFRIVRTLDFIHLLSSQLQLPNTNQNIIVQGRLLKHVRTLISEL